MSLLGEAGGPAAPPSGLLLVVVTALVTASSTPILELSSRCEDMTATLF